MFVAGVEAFYSLFLHLTKSVFCFLNMCDSYNITTSLCQDNANTSSVAAIKEQLRQLLSVTRPSVLLSCRPAQASEIKVSGGVMPDA